jgi:uncharacterized membrane protein HdeD (DUF308 family)
MTPTSLGRLLTVKKMSRGGGAYILALGVFSAVGSVVLMGDGDVGLGLVLLVVSALFVWLGLGLLTKQWRSTRTG